ncbi:MAG: tRNA-specific 2-thiouridylase [Parcubacteria group bacterium Athens0714_26]|nr:MAG: tRNA-specific 2-thiouridylase [Parcubacteria group bacterium Athens0714_26]
MAKKFHLPTADKKDSQGICFLGKVGLQDFLSRYLPLKKGIILDTSGKIIGKHNGAYFYTIGQRRGLNLGNREKGVGSEPYYVAEKDARSNVILVAKGENNPALYIKKIKLTNINWIDPVSNKNLAGKKLKVLMRVRYRQPLFKASLAKNGGKIEAVFDKPQKFVAPGQSAVFYNTKGILLGGGVII